MSFDIRQALPDELSTQLPETPHELPLDRQKVVELVARVREGEQVDLLSELLAAIDWRSAFSDETGRPLDLEEIARLHAYYREKFSDIGPIFLADLISTEFMTEQRAQGDIVFSDQLMELYRKYPDLWNEIRQFFRRKETVTGLLLLSSKDTNR
ncbi:MAG TPA: hypothetical protein VFP05_00675 [Thermomicrobiales bacterium]|jgi:hypothetical protein|nr:hypothetical protein [Thermomicrobiales bacterium]